MSEDKISVYVDDYDSCKKYNYLIVEHKNVRIPSREHAIAAAKALIDHYNIKQEELYPWIACSDRMPADNQHVLCAWLKNGKLITHERVLAIKEIVYQAGDSGREWLSVNDGDLFDWDNDPPTHWHPIPTL